MTQQAQIPLTALEQEFITSRGVNPIATAGAYGNIVYNIPLGSGADSPISLGVFEANKNGTGYTLGDGILWSVVPGNPATFTNLATALVISPDPPFADLDPIGGSPLPANAAQESGGNLDTISANTTGLNTLSKNAGAVDVNTLRFVEGSRGITLSGGFNSGPIAVGAGAVVMLQATNSGASRVWLQVHDKSTALAPGDAPLNGLVYPVEATAGIVFLGVADLGSSGTVYATDTQVALSSTHSTYTAAAAADNSLTVGVLS